MKVTGHRTLVALLSRYYAENLVGMLVASLFFSHKWMKLLKELTLAEWPRDVVHIMRSLATNYIIHKTISTIRITSLSSKQNTAHCFDKYR